MADTQPLAPTDAELMDLGHECELDAIAFGRAVLTNWGTPQPVVGVEPLTPREIELMDGMIAVQLDHAMRCDAIANRAMADKQKGWDMERVALLQKLKAAHGIKGGQHETT